ncbi:MAG: tRNA (adenosine(37)-N6)-threonylcarbamoyltransferase complex transferase subunit TsaD [Syntrophorhabdaceae bacterium]|nr:tRNA (adenosine(37)-N6)-threonylcarbamoyltransferase complex transferase subunit TsaD [Syntrophorhabdales bacterium]MBP9560920.1 tRNA (adenosine(37)-N6)-threonylcarbamoyltransferase complex transferase subunit TsaD [Syntrophorhabdaceae bacterium]
MIILGIDTSCDDTSIAILENRNNILSNIVSSQADLHKVFGGVVPEIASRRHVELIGSIYSAAIAEAGISPKSIDAICVTNCPGLIGSIIVGLCFAKGLALSLKTPLIGINHVEAHAMSIFLEEEIEFPFIGLVVSGGHTTILLFHEPCRYSVIGSTRDDAAGEAFDKVAKFLGIGYPGGQVIDRLSRTGKKDFIIFPRPMTDEDNLDFSFSGLKTAFINWTKKNIITEDNLPDVLASFQEAVFDTLWRKALKAVKRYGIKRIIIGGGVASNSRLREIFKEKAETYGISFYFPSPLYCTDNAAMIAITGSYYLEKGLISPLDIRGFSRMKMVVA